MKVCKTPDCPTLIKADAYKGRCPQCNRDASAERGGRDGQGYGRAHRQLRADYQRRINAGEHIACWRCGEQVTGFHWHLGHDDDDRTITRGPEHALCNLRAAGLASHRGD